MIREFDDKDLERVMEIWLYTNIQTHGFIPKEYWENNYDMVKNVLPKSEVYVYEDEKAVQGFIGVENGYIEGLFVISYEQSKGIGKSLLEKCKSTYSELQLRVYANNTKAVNFYLREGFFVKKEEPDKNTEELEYLMLWRLLA